LSKYNNNLNPSPTGIIRRDYRKHNRIRAC